MKKYASMKSNKAVPFRSRQRGASLLEGIAYLGIAAIVIMGAVSLLSSAFSSAQSNRGSGEIVSLRTAVKKLYAGQAYPAVMLPTLVKARVIPNALVVDVANNTVTNAWGGAVTVAGGAAGFVIGYTKVPQDVCINMVSGASGWTQIDRAGQNAIVAFPATINDATATCVAGDNTINFTAS